MLRLSTRARGLLMAPNDLCIGIARQRSIFFQNQLRSPAIRRFSSKATTPEAAADNSTAAPSKPSGKTVHRGHSRKRAVAEPDVQGPEPVYNKIVYGYETFHLTEPFHMELGGTLPELNIAYETWGKLNADKSNAILLHTGLSASSHAHSHPRNPDPGWWEKFIGPGLALDTNKFFIICSNNLGGCYGTTGPSSPRHPLFKPHTDKHLKPITIAPPDPAAVAQAVKQKTREQAASKAAPAASSASSSTNPPRYALDFPLVTVNDMVSAQFKLLDHLGIKKLYASIGSSLGGMQSLAAAANFPDRVHRCVSISAAGRCTPMAIALRYAQRRVLMSDPNWKDGNYYAHNTFPLMGMKHAREVATISYRSGPEWEERFGRKRIDQHAHPSLLADFMIERYLERQASEFCLKYDPNSLLYISKAMDLFDLGHKQPSFAKGVARVKCPTLIIGVQSDILFPIYQQRELAHALLEAGTPVTFYELNALYGHDTFLIDVAGITSAVKGHLERTDSQNTIDDAPIDTDNY